MREPKRLFESGDAVTREILGFGKEELPPSDLEGKTLAAIATSRLAGPRSGEDLLPPQAAGTSGQRDAAPSWRRPRTLLVGVAIVALGALFARLSTRVESHQPPESARPSTIEQTVTAGEATANQIAPGDDTAPGVALDSLPMAEPPPSATPPSASGVSAASSTKGHATTRGSAMGSPAAPSVTEATTGMTGGSIAREVELLDLVKAKLGAGQAAEASRALDAYDAEFPRGTLRPEATVLRVRALLSRGDRASAEKIGRDFLTRHPAGVHAKRIRELLGEGGGGQGHPDE